MFPYLVAVGATTFPTDVYPLGKEVVTADVLENNLVEMTETDNETAYIIVALHSCISV